MEDTMQPIREEFPFATPDQINKINTTITHGYWGNRNVRNHYLVETAATPFSDITGDKLGESLSIPKVFTTQHVVIAPQQQFSYYQYHNPHDAKNQNPSESRRKQIEELKYLPCFVLINDERGGYTKKRNIKVATELLELAKTAKDLQFINIPNNYSGGLNDACIYMTLESFGKRFPVMMPFSLAEIAFGLEVTEDMELRLSNGVTSPLAKYADIIDQCSWWSHHKKETKTFDFTYETLNIVVSRTGMNPSNTNKFLKALRKKGLVASELKLNGIKKTYQRLEPVMQEVAEESPLTYCAYRSFVGSCNRSVDGVKVSSVFNDVFEKVETKQQFKDALKAFFTVDGKTVGQGTISYDFDKCVTQLPIYREKRKAVIKSQAGRAINKIMDDAESLSIDKTKHKLTWKEIESGNLPIGAFFRKSEQYFILNDNWDLWEEMFKRGFGEQAIELANEVKGRTTYEKDLMSYFYFVLYSLPRYLKKHTGKKWTCIPKIVNSSDELEPPKEEGGTARTRSALTPVADNDANTVVVPYASLAIYGGRGTTYCYSHDYHVLTEGMSFNGYAVSTEIEKKLNGRDDYGLMFYTLTGSAQGRGYPTFLIIFERRASHNDTRVHFHRTHPSRSKDGDYNPIHNWTRVCYNWMAGNVNKDRIKAQQGDLAFVQIKTEDSGDDLDGSVVKGLAFDYKVNKYDNHCFETEVDFAEYTKKAKSNILGYVRLQQDTWLNHNEHDNVLVPQGTYAIHQCRSWEANPKGVWSLRID